MQTSCPECKGEVQRKTPDNTRCVTGRTFSYVGEKDQSLEGVTNTNTGVIVLGVMMTFFTFQFCKSS